VVRHHIHVGANCPEQRAENRPFDQAKRVIRNSDYRTVLRHQQEIARRNPRPHIHCFKESLEEAAFAAIFPNLFVEVVKTVEN